MASHSMRLSTWLASFLLAPRAVDADVLLTGYNPWGNFTENPSGEVADVLNGTTVSGLPIVAYRLDVSEAGVLAAEELVASRDWDAIVHLGFEDSAKGLKLETMALNQRALHQGPVVPLGPLLLPTTADLGAVAMNTHNPHELWSRDAGTFFCNEIYYRSLSAIRTRSLQLCKGAMIPAIFVHVPPLSQMPLAESARFVRDIIIDMVRSSGCNNNSNNKNSNNNNSNNKNKSPTPSDVLAEGSKGRGSGPWWHIKFV
ncbi:unnamed protein product [Polarella glacialis]|uniref:Pyroglutamyl-peptidase I n=1 Tax=Polarella glacialis TaxID=89957 RepID=A0A813D6D7_POLGL|nr:unnamed protein product [Polarella glacialis]